MPDERILQELIRLNGGNTAIGYEENCWFSEKPEYDGLIRKLKETVRNENIRGCVLLATDEEVLWASGSRAVDQDGKTASPLTTFEIGSVTKMFTASLIFRLVEKGTLRLEDRVTDFFPALEQAGGMTVYDLLHMRSGFVDFADEFDTFFEDDEDAKTAFDHGTLSDEVLLSHLYRLSLKFEPGSKMEYCNTNYTLLAMIIEQLTGRPFKENVEETIFRPLGMTSSSSVTWGDVTSVPEGERGYMMEQNTARGAGDIHSNLLDLLRFDRAFFGDRVVSPSSRAAMLDLVDGYGCGWTGVEEREDAVSHSGGTVSYRSLNLVIRPEGERTYLIMLSGSVNDEEEEDADVAGTKEKNNENEKVPALCLKEL